MTNNILTNTLYIFKRPSLKGLNFKKEEPKKKLYFSKSPSLKGLNFKKESE